MAEQDFIEYGVNRVILATDGDFNLGMTNHEQLAQYQKSHVDFKLTEEFLSVLTEMQIQQLKSMSTKAVPED
ncbi:MAG: hypothetical protein ACI8XG_001676 [Congregibacter sp.]|jgi:hypothetical protein